MGCVLKNIAVTFMREYKILSLLLIFAVIVIIKDSDIPVFKIVPSVIAELLYKPTTRGITAVLDGLAFSYIVSVIFYFIVNFLPEQKRKKETHLVIKPVILNLHLYITELVGILDIAKATQGVARYDDIVYGKGPVYFWQCMSDGSRAKMSSVPEEDCIKYGTLIIRCCEHLMSIPNYAYVESELNVAISKIYTCEDLHFTMTSEMPMLGLHKKGGIDNTVTIMKECVNAINRLYTTVQYRFEMMDDNDIKEYKEYLDQNKHIIEFFNRN